MKLVDPFYNKDFAMETRKILVSGGTGFIGQAIVKALSKKGHNIKILSHNPKNLEVVQGDITKPETLSNVCDGFDIVIQCAQFPGHPVENKRKHYTYFEVDALGTENLAKAAKSAGVKYFIYISGAGTDGKKPEPWFKAKWYAEQAIHGTGIPATILRPSWVYGPGDRSLNPIIRALKLCPIFPIIGSGKNHVQPIFVEDLAKIVVACVETASENDRLFDVGGPQEFTMKEMLQVVCETLGKKRILIPIPKALVKFAARFLQLLPTPPLNPKAVDFVTMDTRMNIEPLKKAFPNIQLSKVPGTSSRLFP